MKKQLVLAMLVALTAVLSTSTAPAYGQWFSPYGGYGGYGGFGASDPVSSYTAAYTNGMSNMIRSQGQYNEATARGMISYEQARTQYLDNQQKYLATRQSIKRMAKAENQREQIEAADARARGDEFAAAHRPTPLANSQLNGKTGAVDWPPALKQKEFDDLRQSLGELFEKRARYGGSAENSALIEKKTGEFKDALREHILQIPMSEYSAARKFLDSMSVSS